MHFGWINWINAAVVLCLIFINIIAFKKGLCGDFKSKYPAVNVFEQIGRYGSMIFMIFPISTRTGEFGFGSVAEMLTWLCLTVLLLLVYILLWVKKSGGNAAVLYGLAIVPAVLFLMSGILLQHPALIASALIFGIFHAAIVKANGGE